MSSTKNHKPLANYRKVSKLDELSRKFDLPYDKEISPLNKTDLINISDEDNHEAVYELTNEEINARAISNPNKIPPIGSNVMGTKEMFHQRKYYKEYFFPSEASESSGCEEEYGGYRGVSKNLSPPVKTADLLYDKTFYGKVDYCGTVVYPSEIFLKPAITVDSTITNFFLLNFVADSFLEMSSYIKTLGNTGKLRTNGSNYYPFRVEKGWLSIHEIYHEYMEAVYQTFTDEFATDYQNLKYIRNFEDWLNYFIDFLSQILSYNPITRSNFILKHDIDPSISGLTFQIKQPGHDKDKKKYTDFIRDENFLSIADIAKRYGFYVDKNAPWRFFADVNSVPMKEKMAAYGYTSMENMFDTVFYKAYFYDMEILKTYLISFYNSFATGNPITNVTLPNPTDSTKTMRKIITRDVIANFVMSDKQMLALYYYIRAKERSLGWDQNMFDYEVDYAYGIFKSIGTYEALLYVDKKTRISFTNGGNPGLRTKKIVENRILENINSSNTMGTFKYNVRRY